MRLESIFCIEKPWNAGILIWVGLVFTVCHHLSVPKWRIPQRNSRRRKSGPLFPLSPIPEIPGSNPKRSRRSEKSPLLLGGFPRLRAWFLGALRMKITSIMFRASGINPPLWIYLTGREFKEGKAKGGLRQFRTILVLMKMMAKRRIRRTRGSHRMNWLHGSSLEAKLHRFLCLKARGGLWRAEISVGFEMRC